MSPTKANKFITALSRRLLCVGLFFIVFNPASAQTLTLDLEHTIRLATDSSLAACKQRELYSTSLHNYLSWQASRKPQFSLETTPLMYERYMTRRYLSGEDIDVYRQQRYLYTQAGITATQLFEPFGGIFYGSSQLGYLRSYGDNSGSQFMTVPFSVGYRQELLFYNPLKWARQIEPMRLTQAEKNLAYGIETASLEAVEQFFVLALAQVQLQMTEEYLASCDTIYAIAERRFKIASISKAELSILELEKTNADIALSNACMAHRRAMREMATWLGVDTEIVLVIPTVDRHLHVDADEALRYARENNPKYIESSLAAAEARRDAEKARVEKNFNIGLDVSVGVNQVANSFVDAYSQLLPQDVAMVTLSVPLVDWGKKKHEYLAALSRLQTAERTGKELARDTELDVLLTVGEFNERQAIVESALKALAIAEEAYNQTLESFIKGKADAYSLSVAQSHWQVARQNQIASLRDYWLAYYHLRQLTLYDYQRRQLISYGTR